MPPQDIKPPPTQPEYPIPSLSIRVDTLSHPGAILYFDAVHPATVLRDAVLSSFTLLYTPQSVPTHVESILLVLRPMDGVAYTFGSHTHKEIHFSLDYIFGSAGKDDEDRNTRAKHEIYGVLVHEVVHCFQHNAQGTCPGGLIEGIADYVRLNAGYVPPHWRRTAGDTWDAGYENTAYFLDWIEKRNGPGTVRQLNGLMKDTEYDAKIFEDLTGTSVKDLWELYRKELEPGVV